MHKMTASSYHNSYMHTSHVTMSCRLSNLVAIYTSSGIRWNKVAYVHKALLFYVAMCVLTCQSTKPGFDSNKCL